MMICVFVSFSSNAYGGALSYLFIFFQCSFDISIHFQPTHMADFSHIQAVQTVVGEVCLKTTDPQFYMNIFCNAGWTRQVSATASSGRQCRAADDHMPEHGRGGEHGRLGGRLLQARQPVLHLHMEQERYAVAKMEITFILAIRSDF